MRIGDLIEFGPEYRTPGSTGLPHTGVYMYLGTELAKDSNLGWTKFARYCDKSDPSKVYSRELGDFKKKFVVKKPKLG